jgi:hypothetical protein
LFVPETEEADVESPLPQFDAVETLDADEEFTAPSTVMTPKLGLLGMGTEVMRQFDKKRIQPEYCGGLAEDAQNVQTICQKH